MFGRKAVLLPIGCSIVGGRSAFHPSLVLVARSWIFAERSWGSRPDRAERLCVRAVYRHPTPLEGVTRYGAYVKNGGFRHGAS